MKNPPPFTGAFGNGVSPWVYPEFGSWRDCSVEFNR
jgi:hypothetical protein